MFGIGFSELVVILLAIIVFVNPKDLPAFVRKVGRAWGELQSLMDRFKGE
jgi:Sec-independent protein translocase protein TatA